MAVADERAALAGEAALDRDRAIVREGVARTDRQGRAFRDDERLACVQRCIAKQGRVADDRAGVAVEKNAVGDAAVVTFTTARLDPRIIHRGLVLRANRKIGVVRRGRFYSAAFDCNFVARINRRIGSRGRFDLTARDRKFPTAHQRRPIARSLYRCTVGDCQCAACKDTIAALAVCGDCSAGNFDTAPCADCHIICCRLDFGLILYGYISVGCNGTAYIFATTGFPLRFQVAVILQQNWCRLENFQAIHRGRRRCIHVVLQAIQLCVILQRQRMRCIARLTANL